MHSSTSTRPTMIGVLAPYLGGFYFGDMMTELHRHARSAGIELLSIRAGERSLISIPLAHDLVDGWIIVLDCITPQQLEQIILSGKPVVSIAHDFHRPEIACIQSDNQRAIRQAVDYLVAQGHRDIACVGVFSQTDQIQRLHEFRASLTRHQITPRPGCEIHADHYGYAGGRQAAHALLSSGTQFTAVMCFTDLIASGLMDALQENGLRVPEDVALIGYDNLPLTRTTAPQLATIDQNMVLQTSTAIDMVLDQLNSGVREGGIRLIENTFLPRASCSMELQRQERIAPTSAAPSFDIDVHMTEVGVGYEVTKDLIGVDFIKVLARMWVLAPYLEWACIGEWSDFGAATDRLRIFDVLDLKESKSQELLDTEVAITRFPPLGCLPVGAATAVRFITVVPILFAHKWTVLAVSGLHCNEADIARYPTLLHYIDLLSLAMERSVLDEEARRREARQQEVEREILLANQQLEERVRLRTLSLEQSNASLTEMNGKLIHAHEQLVQSEKLASIGQLAAGVAHEINNPIGYIFSNFGTLQGYLNSLFVMLDAYKEAERSIGAHPATSQLQALRDEVELDYLVEDIPALMGECKEGVTRVRKIVEDLKNFSRADDVLEWQWTDLHQGIDSTLNIINNEIKFKADVVKKYGNLPDVKCLSSQINQVIMNLVVNASHALTRERGTITISTGVVGDQVWIEVADNGCGIPENIMSRIFDPFFTTKPIGKGTGLGLSISYGIIQRHHGQLVVHSETDVGTTFRIVLPIDQAETEPQRTSD
jgi:signal transduction histidine kinase/DNA-binding LacI/PurR family transcriptional regulator